LPLLIDLKPGEKVIINGAVIENAGANTKLRVHNESSILRQKEILTADDAITPASRVYVCLQNAYIFPDKREHYMQMFERLLAEYLEACPSAEEICTELRVEANALHFYKALKASRKLLKHEAMVLQALNQAADAAADVLEDEG
jgi:flagellar protein FlbT